MIKVISLDLRTHSTGSDCKALTKRINDVLASLGLTDDALLQVITNPDSVMDVRIVIRDKT